MSRTINVSFFAGADVCLQTLQDICPQWYHRHRKDCPPKVFLLGNKKLGMISAPTVTEEHIHQVLPCVLLCLFL